MLKQCRNLRTVSTSSTMTEVAASHLKNWSTQLRLWVLKTKQHKSWASSTPAPMLTIWTSVDSSTSLASVETDHPNPHSANSSNTSMSTNKEHSALNNSKRLLPALVRTSQLLKLTKWSTMPIRIETESLTMKNLSTSPPRITQRSDLTHWLIYPFKPL